MVSAPSDDDLFDRFLTARGHDIETRWDRSYNKLQCPECGALHDADADDCTVCEWAPTRAA
jgi:acetone carboxylase gamma subunit